MACVGGFTASAMSDHWSRKWIMQIGVIATTFCTLLIPLVQTAEQLIIVRLMTGLGGGFAVSAAFPIAAELMPARHRRTYGAVYEMSLAASFTLVLLVSFVLAGNPNAFRLMALPGGLALFAHAALVTPHPQSPPLTPQPSGPHRHHSQQPFHHLPRSPPRPTAITTTPTRAQSARPPTPRCHRHH